MPNLDTDLEKHEFLHIVIGFGDCKITLVNSLIVPYKVKHIFIYNTAIKCLGIYPREVKTYATQICTQSFVAPLFLIVKIV